MGLSGVCYDIMKCEHFLKKDKVWMEAMRLHLHTKILFAQVISSLQNGLIIESTHWQSRFEFLITTQILCCMASDMDYHQSKFSAFCQLSFSWIYSQKFWSHLPRTPFNCTVLVTECTGRPVTGSTYALIRYPYILYANVYNCQCMESFKEKMKENRKLG